MQLFTRTRLLFTALAAVLVMSFPGRAAAQTTVHKRVKWDLSSLHSYIQSGGSSTFYLNFQLADGAGIGDGSTAVSVNNAHQSFTPAFAPVHLNDSAFFSSTNRALALTLPSTGPLEFDVSITYTANGGPTPDQFSFALLDDTQVEFPSFGPADAAATFDLYGSGVVVNSYAGDGSRSPNGLNPPGPWAGYAAPEISDVPEPGAIFLFLPALAALGAGLRYRRKATSVPG